MNGTNDPNNPAPQQPADAPAQPAQPAQPVYAQQPQLPQAQQHVRDPRAKSPVLAGFLSIMPGLGQIYVGYYQRGFIHALVAPSLIALLASGNLGRLVPFAAVFLGFFWMYNIIDAIRRATLYNLALAGDEEIEPPRDFSMSAFGGSIFGGLVLVGVGLALLLHTKWDMSLDWIEDWWPVAPIGLGIYLIVRAVQERSASEGSASGGD